MTSQLRKHTPMHRHLVHISRALGLTHVQRGCGSGYNDHMLFGPERDIRDASRAVKRLGFGHAICPGVGVESAAGDQYMLVIKYIWTPEKTK